MHTILDHIHLSSFKTDGSLSPCSSDLSEIHILPVVICFSLSSLHLFNYRLNSSFHVCVLRAVIVVIPLFISKEPFLQSLPPLENIIQSLGEGTSRSRLKD